MTLHFPDEVATNVLTIDAVGPQVGDRGIQGHRDPDRAAAQEPLRRWT